MTRRSAGDRGDGPILKEINVSKILALYVYSPASFTIDNGFECYKPSQQFAKGERQLATGVYRLPEGSTVKPAPGADFELVSVTMALSETGKKNPFPDPTVRAQSVLGFGIPESITFLGGTGSSSTF